MKRWLFQCGWAAVVSLASAIACAQPIERIVSLAPNLTELAFAAGAGDRVVGTAEYSDEPQAARKIPRIGDAFRVDAERILALRPDLVLAWSTGTANATVERLRGLGLNVQAFDTQRMVDVPRVVRELGALAGTQTIAEREAAGFERAMAALRQQYASRPAVSVFLQVNTHPLYTVNDAQIMSELLQICGARNVFADLTQLAPQIAFEAVIARDPDVIIATDDAEDDPLSEWRRWPQLKAVGSKNLYRLPANDMTRATTRLTAGAAALCKVIDSARTKLRRQ